MKIALAQVPHPHSFEEGLRNVLRSIEAAAERGAAIVCFPECCLKGLRGTDYTVEALTADEHDTALERVRAAAAEHAIHVILPTERPQGEGYQNGAYVIAADGSKYGYQTKNQIPLEEEEFFLPGTRRRVFDLDGVPVGIVICHEGWRYPETVRWAAMRGARIVFHPSFGGGPAPQKDANGPWGSTFWEKAMACRAGENHVWFASVNFGMPTQEFATSLVAPDGQCAASAPLHEDTLLVADLDPDAATGFLAKRFASERYQAG